MSTERWPVGLRVVFRADDEDIEGTVAVNTKLPGDICIQWDHYAADHILSYDESVLDEWVVSGQLRVLSPPSPGVTV